MEEMMNLAKAWQVEVVESDSPVSSVSVPPGGKSVSITSVR
jgi:hypothetical protein